MKGKITVMVLAAGFSSRYGGSKLEAMLEGAPLLRKAIDAALEIDPDEVLVVSAPGASMFDLEKVRWIENPAPLEGLSSSIRTGISVLTDETQAVLIVLGDQPLISARHLKALVGSVGFGATIAASVYSDGRTGVPAVFERIHFPALMKLTGDSGAKEILSDPQNRVAKVALSRKEELDIDTPEDLLEWAKRKALAD